MTPIPDDPIISAIERTGYPPFIDPDYDIPDERDDEDEEPETALIEVRQLPIIAERLYQVKEQVELAVREAASMVCTEETVQTVKTKRAELRKQFDELEEQRKAVKTAVMGPYNEFERVYKECISEPFKTADETMKATIDGYETGLKNRCREHLQDYFDELCAVHSVDFLTLDRALALGKAQITLSDAKQKAPKKLMETLREVVVRIDDGVRQIRELDAAAEILDEYKRQFDVGAAIAVVQARKKRIESEREMEERRKADRERRDAAAAKVEAMAPPVAKEPLLTIAFTIKNVTRAQAIKVRNFLKQEGIEFE